MSFLHVQLSQEEREEIREKDGFIKGRQEGIKEGIRESSIEIARKMKAGGISIDQICEFTGLTKEEIEKL